MRLIDADELILAAQQEGAYGYVSAEEIADAPTIDAVQVVRCKDCPNWQTDWDPRSYPSGHYCAMIDKFTDGEWFCATSIQEDD